MFQAGAGWGMGIKKFRIVIVFKSSAAMRNFVNIGWTLKGNADAVLKAGTFGGGIGHVIPFADMTVYVLTEAGVSLTAMVDATKFYKDKDLN